MTKPECKTRYEIRSGLDENVAFGLAVPRSAIVEWRKAGARFECILARAQVCDGCPAWDVQARLFVDRRVRCDDEQIGVAHRAFVVAAGRTAGPVDDEAVGRGALQSFAIDVIDHDVEPGVAKAPCNRGADRAVAAHHDRANLCPRRCIDLLVEALERTRTDDRSFELTLRRGARDVDHRAGELDAGDRGQAARRLLDAGAERRKAAQTLTPRARILVQGANQRATVIEQQKAPIAGLGIDTRRTFWRR